MYLGRKLATPKTDLSPACQSHQEKSVSPDECIVFRQLRERKGGAGPAGGKPGWEYNFMAHRTIKHDPLRFYTFNTISFQTQRLAISTNPWFLNPGLISKTSRISRRNPWFSVAQVEWMTTKITTLLGAPPSPKRQQMGRSSPSVWQRWGRFVFLFFVFSYRLWQTNIAMEHHHAIGNFSLL